MKENWLKPTDTPSQIPNPFGSVGKFLSLAAAGAIAGSIAVQPVKAEDLRIMQEYRRSPDSQERQYGPRDGLITPQYTTRQIGEFQNTGIDQHGATEMRDFQNRKIGETIYYTSRAEQGVVLNIRGTTEHVIDKMQIKIGDKTVSDLQIQIIRQGNKNFRVRIFLDFSQYRKFVDGREKFNVPTITPVFSFPALLDSNRRPATIYFPTR
ncbi:MAG: hypothetical protein H7230_04340 [Candidatus Parcubacteria bacterium]|nr:hypothetical protein [Candidatus Paceibacterota bacterium]